MSVVVTGAGSTRDETSAPFTWPGLALLYLPLFTVALGYGAVLPILPAILERLHGAAGAASLPMHAGLLTGAYIGAFVFAARPWGRVADRRGPRLVLVVGLIGYTAATVWFGFANSLSAAYIARFVAGAFAAGLLPATSRLIVDRCRGNQRSRHFGWLSAASIMGFLAGPALSGGSHAWLGGTAASALHVTAIPIWMSGVLALAAAIGVMSSTNSTRAAERRQDATSSGRALLPRRPDYALMMLSALGAFGVGAFEVGLTLQSQRTWRWQPGELAGVFAVCSLVMLGIQLFLFAPLRRRVASQTLVVGGFVLMAAGLTAVGLASTYALVMSLVVVVSIASGTLLPTLSAITADRAGETVGAAIGTQNAAGNLGQAAGSAAAGWLFTAMPAASFPAIAVVMALAASGAWLAARRRRDLFASE